MLCIVRNIVLPLSATFLLGVHAAQTHEKAMLGMNPIRRVVSLLQSMQKKVTEEGAKETDAYEKFMCYCKTGTGDLKNAIGSAENKLPQIEAALETAQAQKSQLEQDLKNHKAAVADAKKTVAKATALRNKEAATFAKDSADTKSNIAALGKAIKAIEGGSAASFLQSSATIGAVEQLTMNMDMSNADRDMLSEFLSQGQTTATSPSVILGILKQMKDTMQKDLAEITATEEEAVKNFDALVAAKNKEIDSNTLAIESKLKRVGETGIEIEEMKEDLDDTGKALIEDKKLLTELEKGCSTKQAEWEERSKLRAEELLAIGEAIKVLNDDDALDLFKKTLPSPSFMEVQVSSTEVRHRALEALEGGPKGRKHHHGRHLSFIALALRGKSTGFEKVTAMIDEMLTLLGKEQAQDSDKKAYCEEELDKTEDALKDLDRKASDIEKALEEAQDTLETETEDIASLVVGIKACDKMVAEATDLRKKEHAAYKESMSANVAAKKVLDIAGNRLAKFYTPKLYKAPKVEMSEEERISVNFGVEEAPQAVEFVQVRTHTSSLAAPPAPPETWDAYQKQNEGHGGVVALLNMLKADLEKDIVESKVEEKDAQAEYEALVAESASKRTTDVKVLGNKESVKAELEATIQRLGQDGKSTKAEGLTKAETLRDLHMECDWLLSNFEVRQNARTSEMEALKNAKAVLAGADYSLVQTGSSSHLFFRKSM